MTSEYEDNTDYRAGKMDVMVGLYRIVKDIDEKVETILDELKEAVDVAQDSHYSSYYWDEGKESGF